MQHFHTTSNTSPLSRSPDRSRLSALSTALARSRSNSASSPPSPARSSHADKSNPGRRSKVMNAVKRAKKKAFPRSASAPSLLGSASLPSTELTFEVVNRPAIARPIDIPSRPSQARAQQPPHLGDDSGRRRFEVGLVGFEPHSPPRREMPYPKGATPPSSPESGSSIQSTPPRLLPTPLHFGPTSPTLRLDQDELGSPIESVYLSAWQSPMSSQASLPLERPVTTFASLPHEVQLSVLAQLVEVRKADFVNDIRGVNAGARAGLRDLVRLGRVSRAFLALSRDGQLWHTISTRIITPAVACELLPRVSSGFLRALDLERATGLTDQELGQAINNARGEEEATSLSVVKLAGCARLAPTTIVKVIAFSPRLTTLSLMGLQSVSAATMSLLSPESCPHLSALNVSRCANLPASSLVHVISSEMDRADPEEVGPTSQLRTLEAAGLDGWAEGTLAALAKGLPQLEHLDLSSSGTGLTDAAFGLAVAATRDVPGAVRVTRAGTGDEWRRVLPWRVLKLSGSRALTDAALSKLIGTLPKLEVLELADLRRLNAGRGLTGLLSEAGGLRALRKLDLEGCIALEDGVLAPLHSPGGASGRHLTHLVISNCHVFTEAAIQSLIEQAPSLTKLEADGTAISAESVAALLKQQRERRAREALISALDSPAVTTRFYREHATRAEVRPRAAFGGEAAEGMAYHRRPIQADAHDDDSTADANHLDEMDPSRVALRTYAGHIALDKADERRRRRRRRDEMAQEARERRLSGARVEVEDDGDELRGLCTIS